MVGHNILTYIYLRNKNMYTCVVMVGLSNSIELIKGLVAADQADIKQNKDGPNLWLMFLSERSCLIFIV